MMTSLFFIMLVLYVLTYLLLKQKEKMLQEIVEIQKSKLAIIETVEQNIKPLKEDKKLFRYESDYKRFSLAFDVAFKVAQTGINDAELENPEYTISKINQAGQKLKSIIDNLQRQKLSNPRMKNVSYLLIISGYASHLMRGREHEDYELSYNRAYNLWQHWRDSQQIDFEALKYKGLVDLQISGNGWGGVGRFERDSLNDFVNEKRNQRFIIQIVPKIGNTSSE